MGDDLKILVFGDEESLKDLIEYELSKSNLQFTALRVSSREAFLQALQDSSPNLILITTGRTETGGMTALALAQEFCPRTPCFLISPSGRQKKAPAVQDELIHCVGRSIEAGIMMVDQLLSESKSGESLPRARLVRSCLAPAISKGRGLLTRRTGTC